MPANDFLEVPDDLEALSNTELTALAQDVGAMVVGDIGREMIIQRIRKMSLP